MLDRTGPAKDHIGYQALTQSALKGVVRAALIQASKRDHLPGDHHFYITFRTAASGVQMADSLKDRFPEEMTIVIQHQYWDFQVFDDRFEIILKFGGDPQHLRIPFAAMTRFFDPSVNFGMQFDTDATPEPIGKTGDGADASGAKAAKADPDAAPGDAAADATVVSLDAFRRK